VVFLHVISEKSYSFCTISSKHAGTKVPKFYSERLIMSSKFYRLGNYAINFENICYVERIAFKKEEPKLEVYFAGTDQKVSIVENTPEGKALLNWWENMVSMLPNGTEKAESIKLNW
jgi:hypothetical protein